MNYCESFKRRTVENERKIEACEYNGSWLEASRRILYLMTIVAILLLSVQNDRVELNVSSVFLNRFSSL